MWQQLRGCSQLTVELRPGRNKKWGRRRRGPSALPNHCPVSSPLEARQFPLIKSSPAFYHYPHYSWLAAAATAATCGIFYNRPGNENDCPFWRGLINAHASCATSCGIVSPCSRSCYPVIANSYLRSIDPARPHVNRNACHVAVGLHFDPRISCVRLTDSTDLRGDRWQHEVTRVKRNF